MSDTLPVQSILVPVKPTLEMLLAGHHKIDWCRDSQKTNVMEDASLVEVISGQTIGTTCKQDLMDAWSAMLAAAPAVTVGAMLRHHDGRTGAFVCIEEDGRYRVQSLKGKGFWVFHPDDCEQIERLAPAPSSLAGGEVAEKANAIMNSLHPEWSKDHGGEAALGWFIDRLAALSPEAPAREGEVIDAARAVVAEAENIAMTMRRRAIFNRLKEALTPRHEAPGALCDHGHTDPMALCSDCEAASVEAPAEGAVEIDGLIDYLENQRAETATAEGREIMTGWINALRARSSAPEAREGEAESLFKALRDESWDLRCFSVPTGGDDADIGWRVVGHWQAKPCERTVAEVFYDDPAEAVRQALAALEAEGA